MFGYAGDSNSWIPGTGAALNESMVGAGYRRSDVAGLKSGVNHGKALLEKKASLAGEINMGKVQIGGDVGFPIAVAPFNKTEADMREKTDIFSTYVSNIQLPTQARVNFPVDTEALMQITQEKRGALERLQFYEWLAQIMKDYKFSPDIVKFVKEHYPEYFEEQISLIEKNLELQKRAAMLAVKIIPDSREDLEFLYALNTGKITLPQHVAYKHGLDSSGRKENMRRGLLSINGYGKTGVTPKSAPFKIMGQDDTPYTAWQLGSALGGGSIGGKNFVDFK